MAAVGNIGVRFRALTSGRLVLATDRQLLQVERFMEKYLENIRVKMVAYPPKPANSRYVRTGDLGRAWVVQPPVQNPSGLVGRVVNNVISPRGRRYSTYVQGPWQVWYHKRTGWRQLNTVADHATFRAGVRAIMKDVRFARVGSV